MYPTVKFDDGTSVEIYRDFKKDKNYNRLEGSVQLSSPFFSTQTHNFFRDIDDPNIITLSVGLSSWVGNYLIAKHKYTTNEKSLGEFVDGKEYLEFLEHKLRMLKQIRHFIKINPLKN